MTLKFGTNKSQKDYKSIASLKNPKFLHLSPRDKHNTYICIVRVKMSEYKKEF